MRVDFKLNGQKVIVDTPSNKRLIDLLREDFGLMETKASCYQGCCGNCSVLLDNHIVNSCSVLAFAVKGREVVTGEGFAKTDEYQRINRGFKESLYEPCDFCRWGKVFAIHEFLISDEETTAASLQAALKGNQCNCTSPTALFSAIEKIVKRSRRETRKHNYETIIRR